MQVIWWWWLWLLLTASVHGADVNGVVAQGVLDVVEELGDFFVALVLHTIEDLVNQVRLVAAASLDHELTRRSSL